MKKAFTFNVKVKLSKIETVKVLLDYGNGYYFVTPLVEQDVSKYGSEHYIYSIPETKLKEWEQFNSEARKWHRYWKELMNLVDKPRCQHEYLPGEDGTVYHCGDTDNVTYVDGYFYCEQHLPDSDKVADDCYIAGNQVLVVTLI
jgi:hypothetical protein